MIKTFLILLLFILSLFNSDTVIKSSFLSFDIWITKLFPTLFFTFVMIDLIKITNLDEIFGKLLSKIFFPFFRFKYEISYYIFFLSFFCGYPGLAKIIDQATKEDKIDDSEGNYILSFCTFMSPLFLITFLFELFDSKTALLIIILHYTVNLFFGYLMHFNYNTEKQHVPSLKKKKEPILDFFFNSINKNMDILLGILGIVTFFNVLISLLLNYLTLREIEPILHGLFEVLGGTNKLLSLPHAHPFKGFYAVFLLTFGGISLHLQIKSIYKNLNYKDFLTCKILCSFLALLLFLSLSQKNLIYVYFIVLPIALIIIFHLIMRRNKIPLKV